MRQMQLELRFPMEEQLKLPLDYSDCSITLLSTTGLQITTGAPSGSGLMYVEGSGVYWAVPQCKKLLVDEVIVRNPFASIGKTIVQFFKKIFKVHD